MPLTIVRQDITRMQVDAIVNTTGTGLKLNGGVSAAIGKAAGAALEAALKQLTPISVSQAVITPGFALPAKWIIHSASPAYDRKQPAQSAAMLEQTYQQALELALSRDFSSIAFPLISGGVRGYPKEEALGIATQAIEAFLKQHEMDIYLAVFDRRAFVISKQLQGEVNSFIDEHYVALHADRRRRLPDLVWEQSDSFAAYSAPCEAAPALSVESLEEALGQLDEPFSGMLMRLIDQRGLKDAEVYKRANLSRQHFSKIRSSERYRPGKPTVLALALALELNMEETEALLKCAGFALSNSNKFDVIIQFFIMNRRYNVLTINEVLFQHDQPLLGGG